MARSIQVRDIGKYCEDRMEKLLRSTVLETDGLVKSKSPVDTGRFRFGWQVGENAAGSTPPPSGNYSGIPPMQAYNYQAGQEKLGNVYSVHNNLPYAEPLAGGSYPPSWGGQYRSKQAQPGWVQGIAKDVQTRVQTAAARIGRES
jgi:hypothetical protein